MAFLSNRFAFLDGYDSDDIEILLAHVAAAQPPAAVEQQLVVVEQQPVENQQNKSSYESSSDDGTGACDMAINLAIVTAENGIDNDGEEFYEVDVYRDEREYRIFKNRVYRRNKRRFRSHGNKRRFRSRRNDKRFRSGGRKFKWKSYELKELQEVYYSDAEEEGGDDFVTETSRDYETLEEEELEENTMMFEEYEELLET